MAGTVERGAVVVTGASTGIGRACALRLDRLGFQVFAGVRRDEDAAALRREASARLTPLFLDVRDDGLIARAAEATRQASGQGGLRGLVNNAGVAVAAPLEFVPLAELRRQFEVNVVGQVAVTQAFLPLLRLGRGRIVNIGSDSGRMATPFLGPYCASTFALEAISDALRLELAPWGLQVSVVEPGATATALWERAIATADAIEATLPARARELYGPSLAAVRQAAASTFGGAAPAGAVADAVLHALTARRPKTRYAVGNDARVKIALSRLMPDRLRDALILRTVGLPARTA